MNTHLHPIEGLAFSDLRIEEELVYHDRPLCYLLRNKLGHQFLAHYVESSEVGETWYLASLPRSSLAPLLSGQMSLREALELASQDYRFIISVGQRDAQAFNVEQVFRCPQLGQLDGVLPNHSFRFFPDEFKDRLQPDFEPILDYAKSTLSEVFYVSLKGDQTASPALFPLARLATLGSAIQRVITNLVTATRSSLPMRSRGMTQHAFEKGSEFALTGICPGSVRLRLESIQKGSPELLVDYDYAYEGASRFVELASIDNGEAVCTHLRELPPRVASSFRNYVGLLARMDASVNIEWASRRARNKAVALSWSHGQVADIAEKVSALQVSGETRLEMDGFFVQGSMENKKFKFVDASSDRTYEGKFADSVNDDVVRLCSRSSKSALYHVSLLEKASITQTNTTIYEYVFLEVDQVNP